MTSTLTPSAGEPIRHGLRENWQQFSLLVLINAFVGAMIGMERSILPLLAEQEFAVLAHTAMLSFIAVFGISKAITNYLAGHFSDRSGRKTILVIGWWIAAPVPFLLMWAPSWAWILFANVLLGISQGLTWSTTIIMKIDLVGAKNRGLAMGLNEFAGYIAVGLAALATGWVAGHYGLRPQPFYMGIAFVALGLLLSTLLIRETKPYADLEVAGHGDSQPAIALSAREIFRQASWRDRRLFAINQAGLVNNLNDGMAWGLFPVLFAAAHLKLTEIGLLAALYPIVWGISQIFTGPASDRFGRRGLIVGGMWTQAVGIAIVAVSVQVAWLISGLFLLGVGTAMVYPTLIAAIGDIAHPSWRGSAIGVYRFWRDSGYAIGALLSGLIADGFGVQAAVIAVAILTFLSGVTSARLLPR
ncbi:MFS transporter [Permianibacter fluminis]|uniref:MFS transporter n=1 Tax=Permianibacter fluminis TaxID=2738515 RepID=UPI001B7D8A54|nr:MFS transporter [Permianibacter fluminis]